MHSSCHPCCHRHSRQMGSQFITFNVAGQRFTTSKDTILKEPASRVALIVRGVLPAIKDESGAIFLDRDAKYFQVVLNYLRDGWCQLPKTLEERRELLQEIRYYQLAGMEAWLRTQDVIGDASLRPQSPELYSSPTAAYNTTTVSSSSASGAQQQQPAACSSPGCTGNYYVAGGVAHSSSLGGSPLAGYPICSSFLTGANQDLLTVGAFADIRPSTLYSPPYKTASVGSPDPTGLSSSGLSFSPSLAARPASAARYLGGSAGSGAMPVDAVTGYAAGFVAGQQQSLAQAAAAVRRSITPVVGSRTRSKDKRPYAEPASYDAAASPTAAALGSRYIPAPIAQDGFKWTSRYLANNTQMQEVANTLLELAYLPPHPSLHAGKTTISISCECDHDRISGLVGASSLDTGRFRYQVIKVKSSMGWGYESSLRPSSDLALYDKYNIAEYIQDNWFVLTACLKDMYGIVLEEDSSARPKCVACRRSNISVTLQKFF